jgi:hypothetical protein
MAHCCHLWHSGIVRNGNTRMVKVRGKQRLPTNKKTRQENPQVAGEK